MIKWIFSFVIIMLIYFVLPDDFQSAIFSILLITAGYFLTKFRDERDELLSYVDELLQEQVDQAKDALPVRGARLAVDSGAVKFANDWLAAMPEDTIRDFVVKFDGMDKDDWTMWVRMPWGKYKEHKAEVDFAVGRNVMKDTNAN